MVATSSSLPPAVFLEILDHLPRLAEDQVPSTLRQTALVSRQLRDLSQRISFSHVAL